MAELYAWQAALWAQLSGRREHAHAYLLQGPSGIGKRALAESLGALLLCHSPKDGQARSACGECKGCRLLAAGSHPDSFLLQPEEADKAILVDQVRRLVDFVAQTAQLGGRKVVLVEPVEALNLNAANALLKSLEEPSGDTVMLLVSHQPSRLLPTIRSRCVQQPCPLPSPSQANEWLADRLPDVSAQARQQLLALAAGSPLAAVQLQEQSVLDQRALVVEGIKRLLKQQQSPTQLAESWNGVPLIWLLDWFCDWSQRILRYQLTQDPEGLGLSDMHKVLQYLAQKAPTGKVVAIQDWLLQHRQKVLTKANLNRVLLLETLLVSWLGLTGQA
ncbi:DNA polymerase III subunit delta' [Pseudomonas sp. DC3000-4b1]|uniref:DNA polymerase III subunit delta' n=1 Tax=unclassified Pseudomonas TaxID=196821 RepID=UPI003CF2108D